MAYIEWFERGEVAKDVVGGKGASLALLAAAGFPVPPGFTLTTEAYHRFTEAAGIETSGGPEAVRDRFQAAGLPPDVIEAVTEAYADLTSRIGHAAAVRSSAPSEDGGARSSAGLYESYLNIQGIENILDAIKRCYLSLWSDRAVGYRSLGAAQAAPEAMAVVVMSLVPSDVAGVAFTAHPVTGALDLVLINSSWGLGEAVVSGMVTPDSFVVSKPDMSVLEREVYEKAAAIRPQADGSGTMEVALAGSQTKAASFTDEQAIAVARLSCAVEDHFGHPQDIEWAWADGTLYLLQARPITTLV